MSLVLGGRRFAEVFPPAPPSGLWVVKGDEELAEYHYRSRTADPDWLHLAITPSVFRFEKTPREPASDYRVDITPLHPNIYRLNDYDTNTNHRMARLYSSATALFNNTGFPRQQYLVMSGCRLDGVVEGNYLRFKTATPTADVSQMTYLSHPQYVMKWDLVTFRDGETLHVKDRYGDIFWFLCTVEGFGYIPLRNVKPA